MSRYYLQFYSQLPPEAIAQNVSLFYASNGFKEYVYKNEIFYKKGQGFLLGPQIMRVIIEGNLVTVEAFTRMALLPFVFVGEIDLDSGFGAIPNQELKKKIQNLVANLAPATQPVQIPFYTPGMQQQYLQQQYAQPQYVPQQPMQQPYAPQQYAQQQYAPQPNEQNQNIPPQG